MSRRDDASDWMWSHAWGLLEEAARMHRQFFHVPGPGRSQGSWEPPADVFEDEREIVVVVAMPGVPANRIELSSEPGALVVRGRRALPFAGPHHIVRHLEIPYGWFERRVPIPAGNLKAGTHEVADGCLIVRFRKLA